MARTKKDMDRIVADLLMVEDLDTKHRIAKKIISTGYKQGVYSASINEFYQARGRNEISGFTVGTGAQINDKGFKDSCYRRSDSRLMAVRIDRDIETG